MKLISKITLVCTSILLLSGCWKNNDAPVFIEINPWKLEANSQLNYQEGVLTSSFTNAKVFIDGKVIGIFELPCKIPVLQTGTKNILVYPVIRKNGVNSAKAIYPFMEPYKIENAVLVSGKKLVINPITKYASNTKFWIEDFEDVAIKFITDPSSTAEIGITTLANGNRVAKVDLTSEKRLWLGYTDEKMQLKQKGEVYVEIEYATSFRFLTGVLGISQAAGVKNNPNLFLNSTLSNNELIWKKVYIDISEIVNYTQGEYFEQYLRLELPSDMQTGTVMFDNIKVVNY